MTWIDDLHDNGIMMREYDVANALIEGVVEKTSMVDSSPTITIASLDGCGFCSALDANITAIAPSFLDENNSAYSSDLSELCSAAGYNTVVYGATPGTTVLKNGGVQLNTDYVAQRKDILALFTNTTPITLPSSMSIYFDTFLVDTYTEPLTLAVNPADAYSDVYWSTSDPNIATVSSNGIVTCHSYGSVTITATCKKDSTITASTTKTCYVSPNINPLAELVKENPSSYTQIGVTLTHNNDGTFTLNGKVTSDTYVRYVLWPIGNDKTAYNLKILNEIDGDYIVYIKSISGSLPESSRTRSVVETGNPNLFDLYAMHKSTQFTNQISHADHYTSSAVSQRRFAFKNSATDPLTAIVFGFRFYKNTTIDYTFEVGAFLHYNSTPVIYDSGILNDYLCPIYKPVTYDYKRIMRHHNNIFNAYINDNANCNIRLTSSLAIATSASGLTTSDVIGVVGHKYKLTIDIVKFVATSVTSSTVLKLWTKGSNGADIFSVDVINGHESADSLDLSGTTYTAEAVIDTPINIVGIYMYDLTSSDHWIDFAIKLEDITE